MSAITASPPSTFAVGRARTSTLAVLSLRLIENTASPLLTSHLVPVSCWSGLLPDGHLVGQMSKAVPPLRCSSEMNHQCVCVRVHSMAEQLHRNEAHANEALKKKYCNYRSSGCGWFFHHGKTDVFSLLYRLHMFCIAARLPRPAANLHSSVNMVMSASLLLFFPSFRTSEIPPVQLQLLRGLG